MLAKHKKLLLIGLVAVALLAIVAVATGPYIYKGLMESRELAPTVDESAISDAKVEDTDPASLNRDYTVSGGSYAGYRVEEVLQGVDVTVTGRTSKVTGDAVVKDSTLSSAEIVVDMASVTTDNPGRDSAFRSTILYTYDYPTAKFTLTEPLQLPDSLAKGDKATVKATGELMIHGTTRKVTIDLEVGYDGKNIQAASQIPITFSDYKVQAPKQSFVTVEDEGFIEVYLVLGKK